MQACVFQHVPFEGPGKIADWLERQGAAVRTQRWFDSSDQVDLKDVDLLVVMGGPMNVDDTATYPWLMEERQAIQQAIQRSVWVLGICLGAQLIARVLGAEVRRNWTPEIGWFPIQQTEPKGDHAFSELPEAFQVLHWHSDMFDVPPGARLLARSEACRHQAFQWNEHVLALQFHLELGLLDLQSLTTHCASDLISAPYVQRNHEIDRSDVLFSLAQERLFRLLDRWTRGAPFRR